MLFIWVVRIVWRDAESKDIVLSSRAWYLGDSKNIYPVEAGSKEIENALKLRPHIVRKACRAKVNQSQFAIIFQ